MKLTKPLAIGMLILLALLILWLVQQSMGGNAPDQSEPVAPTTSRSDVTPGVTPTGDSLIGSDGPTGVDTRDWDDINACRDQTLPDELDPVVNDIEAGGPYEHDGKDGSTFGNRERELPQESRGYYREFTIQTPGSRDRGARRVVTGGPEETDPEVWYYTDDHYASFCEFAP
ncbi:MAG: ribonuclease domain-containing protein [Ornithinimicrobium sp.]|uniref:ribonuclease domain-containing protein n=1 Tax=Ornithinimicrobium sp. TaxID=1977084 RepID=UPI0026E0A4E4|nr:ribonuclease domain-containing protein [Ornithinimicrobium sp.]MDO5739920.1 ribonuclease domain-containing protein [Ornithinimicrobium sp.]